MPFFPLFLRTKNGSHFVQSVTRFLFQVFSSASELWEHHLHSFNFCRHQLYHLCVSIMINQTDYENSMFCARNCSGCKWLANQKKMVFCCTEIFSRKVVFCCFFKMKQGKKIHYYFVNFCGQNRIFFSIEMEKYGRYVTYLFSIEFGGKIHLFTSSLFSRFGKEKKFKLIRHNTIQINPTLLTLKSYPFRVSYTPIYNGEFMY